VAKQKCKAEEKDLSPIETSEPSPEVEGKTWEVVSQGFKESREISKEAVEYLEFFHLYKEMLGVCGGAKK